MFEIVSSSRRIRPNLHKSAFGYAVAWAVLVTAAALWHFAHGG